MLRYTKSEDPQLRIAAYTALGRIHTDRVVEILIQGMEDKDEKVAKAAEDALKNMLNEPVLAYV